MQKGGESMLKFLHVSDLHLNAGFANKSEKVRARLKESLKMAFEKAVAYTLHQIGRAHV